MSAASDASAVTALASVTTATVTTILLKKGLRNVWIRSGFPLTSGVPRIVERAAFTVRFIPVREDLAMPASRSSRRVARHPAASGSLVPLGER